MQMTGEQLIAAPRDKVWAALNDPEVLRQAIPGCQSLSKDTDDSFTAVAEIRIGPIGARFKGKVQLSDIDAPNGYTISGSGNGGIAGNAKGGAKVRLSDGTGGTTLIAYEVDAEVGGRMAQLGGPIIDATARNLAGKFFAKFGEVVGGSLATPAMAALAAPASPEMPIHRPAALAVAPATIWGWVGAVIAALLAGYVLGLRDQSPGSLVFVLAMLVVVAAAAFEAGKRGSGR